MNTASGPAGAGLWPQDRGAEPRARAAGGTGGRHGRERCSTRACTNSCRASSREAAAIGGAGARSLSERGRAMILTVDHVTTYRYDRPVRGRGAKPPADAVGLRRAEGAGLGGHGDRRPEGRRVPRRGGGLGAGLVGAGPGQRDRRDGARHGRDAAIWPGVLRGHRETIPPEAYLRETLPTRVDAALAELARQAEGADRPAGRRPSRCLRRWPRPSPIRPGATAGADHGRRGAGAGARASARTMPMR